MGVILSVLIPAYGNAEGVDRILSNFREDPPDELEILISDDSRDEQVNQLVTDFSRQYFGKLKYRRNQPGLGAVVNWNSLLTQASGDYILLLHHDEYPLVDRFAWQVLELLSKTPAVDVFVMDCILMSPTGSKARPHLPRVIRNLFIRHFPSYLFKRNVIGPASCLIVRRTLYPQFDECLRWLVDVEAYFRLRQHTVRWNFCSELKIGSTLGRKDSITASIKDELEQIDFRERTYLLHKYPVAEVWLAPRLHWALNMLETVAWGAMRIVTRVWYRIAHFSRLASFSTPYLQRTTKNDHK